MKIVAPSRKNETPKHVVTGLAVLRFPTLKAPEHVLDSPKRSWGATLVFPPAGFTLKLTNGQDLTFDAATLPVAEEALLLAFAEKFPGPANLAKLKASMTSANPAFKWGVRKDNADRKWIEGSYRINARRYEAQGAPTLVDAQLNPVTAPEKVDELFYEGAVVRAGIDAYAYDMAVSKGTTFSLVNLQHVAHAPPVKYGPQPGDDFEEMVDAAQPADLSDLGVK